MKKVLIGILSVMMCLGIVGCGQEEKVVEKTGDMYELSMYVECDENLFLSKYDVKVFVDGEEVGVVDHGGDNTFTVEVVEGMTDITFQNKDDSSADGQINVKVESDTSVAYRIYCHNDRIDIDDIAKEKESEISMPFASNEKVGVIYTDLQVELEGLGFENIELVPTETYDSSIVDGSVTGVAVNGYSFDKNEVVRKDDNVKIEYMKQAEVITAENNEEFKNILEIRDNYSSQITNFANKYAGKIIEFDGYIAYMDNYGYEYLYTYLIYVGNAVTGSDVGTHFQIRNRSYDQLNLVGDVIPPTVMMGQNYTIRARVVEFNAKSGLFYIEPISMEYR